ncbi:MAG: M10 family metallopeptidase C-terminal domain-containing protein [Marinobacterium sp.]|nr:M10 family metallopeptidase C-terminal domain-containing protein [Marinobacterium sp.]
MAILILNQPDEHWVIPATSGSTTVYGTAYSDTITVSSGVTVSLLAFGANDTVILQGDSAEYSVKNSGSTVYLTHADGTTVSLAAGLSATNINFADATAQLSIDASVGAIKLDEQIVTSDVMPVTLQEQSGVVTPAPVHSTPIQSTPAVTSDGGNISSENLTSTGYQYANETITDSLLGGSMWGKGVGQGVALTYSFPAAGATWEADYSQENEFGNGFQALNATHQQGVRDALSSWAEVANITFTEVSESASQVGDLRFGFSADVTGQTAAWAYAPHGFASNPAGASADVWINPQSYSDTGWNKGTDNYHTLIHEVGHGLGLKHSFWDAGGDNGNGTVLTGDQESMKYTIMSYSGHADMGNVYTDNGDGTYNYKPVSPATPLLYDIKAMQYMYGANYATRTGDDTYSYSASNPFIEAIWDAGGNDTIDASNQTYGVTIKLTAGELSSVGTRYQDFQVPSAAQENLAIAYGVEIENAIGSANGDTLIGNALNNHLTGGKGNDMLHGGAGIDTAIFSGNRADYQILTDTGSGLGTEVIGADGADQLADIEFVQFSDQTVELALLS